MLAMINISHVGSGGNLSRSCQMHLALPLDKKYSVKENNQGNKNQKTNQTKQNKKRNQIQISKFN